MFAPIEFSLRINRNALFTMVLTSFVGPASAYLSTLWSKKAGPVYNDAGDLIPWQP